MAASPDSAADRTVIRAPVADALRQRVFNVLTNPEHIVHWWGPSGFRNSRRSMDVRKGGKFLLAAGVHGAVEGGRRTLTRLYEYPGAMK